MTKSVATSLALLGSALALSATARAATETDSTQYGDGAGQFTPTYTAPANDLLLGLTPTLITPNEAAFDLETAGGTPILTNGAFGPITVGGAPGTVHPSFATGGGSGGTQLIYSFAQPSTITSVVTLGGWNDGGRDTQAYTVSYGIAGVFTSLATVNFNPTAGAGQTASQVVLDGFGSIANVDQIKFDFASAENGYQGYAELAVVGTVPEPSAVMALASGAAMLLGFRRRTA